MKKLLGFFFFVFTIGVVLYFNIDAAQLFTAQLFDSAPTALTGSVVVDGGNVSVFFCPRQNCETAFLQFLDSAQISLHCALFEIDLVSVQQALRKKAQQIEVQVVTDNGYLHQFNESYSKADTYGLMHNKFCVVDSQKVFTGSMNPTDNDAHKNNNNLLFIHSPLVARNYEEEFQEMWSGTFKKGQEVKVPAVLVGDTPLDIYFCPEDHCAERVIKELEQAKESIHFMTFSFTHDGIANVLLLKHLENISLSGVMEARQITKYSVFEQLKYQGIDVLKDGNPRNLHHKVFIIDGKTVVTGSFNPTDGGDRRNDENVVIIHDSAVAKLFLEEYELVRKEAELKKRF